MPLTVKDSTLTDKTVCVLCNGKTSINRSYNKTKTVLWIHYHWYWDEERQPHCHRCYRKKLTDVQEKTNKHRYHFFSRIFYLSYNPRTGHCSECPNNIYDGSCKKTDMHHSLGYFIIFPWFGMIELCSECHGRLTPYRKGIPPWHKKRTEGYIMRFMSTVF